MQDGWIKLYRKSLNSRVFKNRDLWQLWTWCLMKATHKKTWVSVSTGRGETEVELQPGQFIFGRKQAAQELKAKPFSTYKRMLKLKKLGNLDIQSNTHFSIVTICNWDKYQAQEIEKEQAKEQPRNNQGTTKEQPRNTNKNVKNDKNVKNNNTPPKVPPKGDFVLPDWFPKNLWEMFLSHRRAVKAPIRKESYSLIVKKFENLKNKGWPPDKVIGIIIERGWRWFKPEWIEKEHISKSDVKKNVFLFPEAEEDGEQEDY